MSISLGDAILYFRGDRRPLSQALDASESEARGWASRVGGALQTGVTRGFQVAAAGAAAGVAAIGAAAGLSVREGLQFNDTIQQASARINAFTKDAAATADILEMVQQRAASTPFAFGEMANSVAALIPVSRASGEELEKLQELAEILAASNPAQGLEGAAFALREAAGGDFVSLMERFDLPRTLINQLKEEGLPNIEIVRRAMLEMGYDATLVSNMARTNAGRWSTFWDTITGLQGRGTKRLFDEIGRGLELVQGLLDENIDTLGLWADRFGEAIGARVGRVIDDLAHRIRVFQAAGGGAGGLLQALGFDPRDADRILGTFRMLERGIGSIVESIRLLLTGDFRGGIFDWMEDDSRISALFAFRNTVRDTLQSTRDSITTFFLAWRGEWEDDESIQPIHRFVGRVGTAAGELRDKLGEVRAAFEGGGWREALRELVPKETAVKIEGVVEALDRLAERIGAFVQTHGPDLAEGFAKAAAGIAAAGLAKNILSAVPALGSVIGLITKVHPLLLLLGVTVGLLALGWKTNFGNMRDNVTTAWDIISPVFDELGGGMRELGDILIDLARKFGIEWPGMEGVVNTAGQLMILTALHLREEWEEWRLLVNAIARAVGSMATAFGTAMNDIIGALDRAYNQRIRPLLNSIIESINAVIIGLNTISGASIPTVPEVRANSSNTSSGGSIAPPPQPRRLPPGSTDKSLTTASAPQPNITVNVTGNNIASNEVADHLVTEAVSRVREELNRQAQQAMSQGTLWPHGVNMRT